MSELSKRRSRLLVQIQRKERRDYLSRVREEMLSRWKQQKHKSEMQEILYAAFIAYEEDNGPYIDIYVNVESILDEIICVHRTSNLAFILSNFLYISLSSSIDVITYMVETNAVRQWEKMAYLLECNTKCEQLLYQRMRVFLETICAKYNIESFNTQQFEGQIKQIFCELFTDKITRTPFAFDQNSEFYTFIQTYISLMPNSHLVAVFTNGCSQSALLCNDRTLALILISKIDALRNTQQQMNELYERFYQKWLQQNCMYE